MEMSLKYIMGKKIFKWMQVSGEYNFIILGAPKCHNPTVLGGGGIGHKGAFNIL